MTKKKKENLNYAAFLYSQLACESSRVVSRLE